MSGGRFLKRALKVTALSVVFGLAARAGLDIADIKAHEAPGRTLTTQENGLLRSIFGKQLNTKPIRLHMQPGLLQGDKPGDRYVKVALVYSLPFLSNDIFFSKDHHSDNYASKNWMENPPENLGYLAHEATHVWQNQNLLMKTKLFCEFNGKDQLAPYHYELKEGAKFTDYCGEQQAAMVQHYALYYLHPGHIRPAPGEMKGSMAQLRDIVEAQFPQARLTREKLQAKLLTPDMTLTN